MQTTARASFEKMNALSSQGIPFFFITDFLSHEVQVFLPEALEQEGILVDFPTFKNFPQKTFSQKEIQWSIEPEGLSSYQKGFDFIQHHLKRGNTYLINYTRQTPIDTNLSLEEIFYLSEAKYKLLYRNSWTFFSPETFVRVDDHRISTQPMKGTIDANLPHAIALLKENKKEKAEHYTVIDLLRNDLSKVANGVTLDHFQRIDLLKTQSRNLYTMSSEISGSIKPNFRGNIGSIMKELLPAGSILGAPKTKTLEISLEAEGFDRGFYTGVCGWFDGECLDSCVMIRFIEQQASQLVYKSGGGITHQSSLTQEYEEMKSKIYVPIY